MKAIVIGIESGTAHEWNKGRRQITLKITFDDRNEIIKVPEPEIGIVGLALDDVLHVVFSVHREQHVLDILKEKQKHDKLTKKGD